MMDVLLNAVLPIFAVTALGFVYGRKGVLGQGFALELNRFVFYFAQPVLLFALLASMPLEQFDWGLMLGYFMAELSLYTLGFFIAWRIFKRSRVESLLIGMTAGFVNHVMFVLPIAQQIYGDAATIPIVQIIALDSVVLFAGTILILETVTNKGKASSLLSLLPIFARNPQIIGIGLGVAVMVSGLEISGGLKVFANFVGNSAAPASLFALGIVLALQKLTDFAPAAVFAGLKLFLMPLVCWVLIVLVFGVSPEWANPALLVAAGPAGAMPFVLAMQYRVPVSTVTFIVLISTFGSVITLTLMTQFL